MIGLILQIIHFSFLYNLKNHKNILKKIFMII